MVYRVWWICLLTLGLTGCLTTDWVDVSHEDKHRSMIGGQVESKVDLAIHAVTMARDYEPVLHHYTLMKAPGFSGPEVLHKEILPAGIKFEVSKVVRCDDCVVKRENVVLKAINLDGYDDAPIFYSYNQYVKAKSELFN